MHRSCLQPTCTFVAAMMLTALPTNAWPSDAPTAAELSAARDRFAEGRALEEAGKFSEALEVFEGVGRVKMTPQVRFHTALCLMHTGKHAASLRAFRLAMNDAHGTAPNVVAEAKEHIASLEKRVAVLTVVTASDDSLDITIDGHAIASDTPVDVDPGDHTVTMRQRGETLDERHVTLAAGERSRVDFSDVNDRSNARRTAGFALFGAAGAAALTTGIFVLLRAERLATLEAACPSFTGCDRSLEPVVRDGKTFSSVVNVLAGVTLAAAATGIVLFVPSAKSSKPSSRAVDVRVRPVLGFGSGFVVVQGTF